eukprot:scaffold447_cov307-Pinguiococcus_pyrenoidosus.AAC.45
MDFPGGRCAVEQVGRGRVAQRRVRAACLHAEKSRVAEAAMHRLVYAPDVQRTVGARSDHAVHGLDVGDGGGHVPPVVEARKFLERSAAQDAHDRIALLEEEQLLVPGHREDLLHGLWEADLLEGVQVVFRRGVSFDGIVSRFLPEGARLLHDEARELLPFHHSIAVDVHLVEEVLQAGHHLQQGDFLGHREALRPLGSRGNQRLRHVLSTVSHHDLDELAQINDVVLRVEGALDGGHLLRVQLDHELQRHPISDQSLDGVSRAGRVLRFHLSLPRLRLAELRAGFLRLRDARDQELGLAGPLPEKVLPPPVQSLAAAASLQRRHHFPPKHRFRPKPTLYCSRLLLSSRGSLQGYGHVARLTPKGGGGNLSASRKMFLVLVRARTHRHPVFVPMS